MLVVLIVFLSLCQSMTGISVISHRGSGYLPELTLETQAMGYAYGADMIEIDINLSKDNQLIVGHGEKNICLT